MMCSFILCLSLENEYSRYSCNGHLYKMDTLEKQKPRVGVGPYLSLLPLIFLLLIIWWTSLLEGQLVPVLKVSILERDDFILRQNQPGHWVILIFGGQKSGTRII